MLPRTDGALDHMPVFLVGLAPLVRVSDDSPAESSSTQSGNAR
jgi:hypothetical protein